MKGLSFKDIKQNPALIPLYVCLAAGLTMSALYVFRLATRNPDVTWSQTKNPEPWQEYSTKQYKLYSPTIDYTKVESPAPKF